MDMGFIDVNQQAALVERLIEHDLQAFQKGSTLGRLALIQ